MAIKMNFTVPPLLLGVLLAGLMYFVSLYTTNIAQYFVVRFTLSICLLVIAALFLLLSVNKFKVYHTTVNPTSPEKTSSLVTSGIYAISRNPMYVSFTLMLLALVLLLGNFVALLMVVFFIIYINASQIPKEEQALQALFGQQYLNYKKNVRRWL